MAIKRGNPPGMKHVRASIYNHYVRVEQPKSLIFVSGRMGGAPRLEGAGRRERLRPLPEQADSMRSARRRLADVEHETDAAAEAASTRQTWLLAGRTISPRNRSIRSVMIGTLYFSSASSAFFSSSSSLPLVRRTVDSAHVSRYRHKMAALRFQP